MDDLAAAVVMSEGTEVRVSGAERALGLGVGGCHIAVEVERREVPHPGRRNLLDDAAEEGVAEECLNRDRKSTRLNSSHSQISYAVFCLKKKKNKQKEQAKEH